MTAPPAPARPVEIVSAGDGSAESFRDAVVQGLAADAPALSPKWLYDAHGAALFEEICEQPEYYPTRAETTLLSRIAPELAGLLGERVRLAEPGSGAAAKIRILLRALGDRAAAAALFDISAAQLAGAAAALQAEFPALEVRAVSGDFTARLPEGRVLFGEGPGQRVLFFPGSTLGNFPSEAQARLLRGFRDLVGPGGKILLGLDTVKAADRLEAAYDDAAGVTALFSLNLLERIAREPGGAARPEDWRHEAEWQPEPARIRIRLRAVRPTEICMGEWRRRFEPGDAIHVEDSHKYTIAKVTALCGATGLELERCWGAEGDFMAALLDSPRPMAD